MPWSVATVAAHLRQAISSATCRSLPIPQTDGVYVICVFLACSLYVSAVRPSLASAASLTVWIGTFLFVAAAAFGAPPGESKPARTLPQLRAGQLALGALLSAPALLYLA